MNVALRHMQCQCSCLVWCYGAGNKAQNAADDIGGKAKSAGKDLKGDAENAADKAGSKAESAKVG